MRSRVTKLIVGLGLVLAGLSYGTSPASAGGAWFTPVHDRYEAGDRVTVVGYTGGQGALGTIDDGPFFGYLRRNEQGPPLGPTAAKVAPFDVQPSDIPLGPLTVEATTHKGYLLYRATITFDLPADIAPGQYGFLYCNAHCTKGFADLIGGLIHVDVDPLHPVMREWALDDPEIPNLLESALLVGPRYEITAGQLRAGAPLSPPTTTPPTSAPAATVVGAAATPSDSAQAVSAERSVTGSKSNRLPLVLVLGGVILAFAIGVAVRRACRGAHL